MKDRPLLSVTEILDDSTGMWSGELCDFAIHGTLQKFLERTGKKGRDEILNNLSFLTHTVWERWGEQQKKKQSLARREKTKPRKPQAVMPQEGVDDGG